MFKVMLALARKGKFTEEMREKVLALIDKGLFTEEQLVQLDTAQANFSGGG